MAIAMNYDIPEAILCLGVSAIPPEITTLGGNKIFSLKMFFFSLNLSNENNYQNYKLCATEFHLPHNEFMVSQLPSIH